MESLNFKTQVLAQTPSDTPDAAPAIPDVLASRYEVELAAAEQRLRKLQTDQGH